MKKYVVTISSNGMERERYIIDSPPVEELRALGFRELSKFSMKNYFNDVRGNHGYLPILKVVRSEWQGSGVLSDNAGVVRPACYVTVEVADESYGIGTHIKAFQRSKDGYKALCGECDGS